MHRQQIPIKDADINHRQATHLEQKIGPRTEQSGIQCITSLHVLNGKNRRAGRHAANQRQTQLLDQANAACRTGFKIDCALGGAGGVSFMSQLIMTGLAITVALIGGFTVYVFSFIGRLKGESDWTTLNTAGSGALSFSIPTPRPRESLTCHFWKPNSVAEQR